jgi:YD repeat-containing protein
LDGVDELCPTSTVYNTTTYGYDALGNLKTVQQGSGPGRTFQYDQLSRLTTATNPESGTVTYQYDGDGNLKLKTDARGVQINYSYDPLNRIMTRQYTIPQGVVADPTPNVTYTYDTGLNETVAYSTGRLTSVSSSVSTETVDNYDPLGRVLNSTQTTNGQAYPMIYTYNLGGGMTSETYPSGRVVDSGYDNAGRLDWVTGTPAGGTSKNYATQFSYTAPGGISSLMLGNNLWEHTNFNSRLQPYQIGLGTSSTDSSTFGLTYTFGVTSSTNNGNISSETITAGTSTTMVQNFTYDQVNRLATVAETNNGSTTWSRTFSYDVYGNIWVSAFGGISPNALTPTVQSAYNTKNQLVSSGYDPAGNQSSDNQGGAYFYDCENKMTRCTVDGMQSTYSYDGNGRRITKTVNGPTTFTTLFVYNSDGELIAEYGGPLPENGGTSYLTTDHLGSTRVVTNSEEAVVARHDYLPFGEEIMLLAGGRTKPLGYTNTDDTRQKFTGKGKGSGIESGLL